MRLVRECLGVLRADVCRVHSDDEEEGGVAAVYALVLTVLDERALHTAQMSKDTTW